MYQNSGFGFGGGLVWLGLVILMVVAMVKIFQKAGREWWEAIIPIYNVYVMLKIVGKPGWWIVLYFIPLVNIVISIIALHALSLRFGKGAGFTVGLIFLPIVFYPILGFGDAQYMKAATPVSTDTPAA
jgi:hypothetical protein